MDLGDNSVCEECAMICTDVYSDEEYKNVQWYVLTFTVTKNMKRW